MTSAAPDNTGNRADAVPKSWNPGEVEGELYGRWVAAGYFTTDPHSSAPGYSIVLPPPNVTGTLHMGHALDHTLMDTLARRKRMQGRSRRALAAAEVERIGARLAELSGT